MNDRADEAVFLGNRVDLLLPQIDRVVVQDVEQGIILDRRERELENLPNEERHQAATAPSLRIRMRYAGHGQIVRKL